MKAAESKTTTVAQHLQAKGEAQQPFFQQQEARQGSFFGNELPAAKPFFRPFIQTKLNIGQPGDKYEQEADAMAEKVVQRMADGDQLAGGSSAVGSGAQVQMKCAKCEQKERLQKKEGEEEETILPKIQKKPIFESNEAQPGGALQAKSDGALSEASPDLESRLNASRGGGQVLPDNTRGSMESAFGTDFSSVRVHTGSEAVQMNQELGAQAFTHGSDVYFGSGKYDPGSTEGNRLLGHELTHVVQQGGGSSFIQRILGDGHDLSSPRFAGDTVLEDVYDGNRSLREGDSGSYIGKIQHALQDAGIRLRRSGIDEEFGNETKRGVTVFQRQKNITTDAIGEIGAATIGELDSLFQSVALPANASGPYDFDCMVEILCGWNEAMINDLQHLNVRMVGDLSWADERFDGTSWRPDPTPGSGETTGNNIYISTADTCENVAKALYHEYQHARIPRKYRRGTWAAEEEYAFTVETNWAIARGLSPDPDLTSTDPATGQTVVNPAGISSNVASYPGLGTANPGEIIGKVGANQVRVRMPDGSITVRNAVAGDTVEGPAVITPPNERIRRNRWRCP